MFVYKGINGYKHFSLLENGSFIYNYPDLHFYTSMEYLVLKTYKLQGGEQSNVTDSYWNKWDFISGVAADYSVGIWFWLIPPLF